MGRMAAAGLMITLGLLAPTAQAQQASPAQSVTTAVAERGELHETVHLDGIIEAVQQSTVSAQTSGTVQSLPFDVDDSVAAGDPIVQLEDSEQRSRLRQAQAGLEEAEAASGRAAAAAAAASPGDDDSVVSGASPEPDEVDKGRKCNERAVVTLEEKKDRDGDRNRDRDKRKMGTEAEDRQQSKKSAVRDAVNGERPM